MNFLKYQVVLAEVNVLMCSADIMVYRPIKLKRKTRHFYRFVHSVVYIL